MKKLSTLSCTALATGGNLAAAAFRVDDRVVFFCCGNDLKLLQGVRDVRKGEASRFDLLLCPLTWFEVLKHVVDSLFHVLGCLAWAIGFAVQFIIFVSRK